MYSTAGTHLKKLCLQNKLNLLDASVRHLGTDINYIVLENLYAEMKDKIDFYFDTPVTDVEVTESGFRVCCGAACAMNVTSVSFLSVEAEANGWRYLLEAGDSHEVKPGGYRRARRASSSYFSHLTDELYGVRSYIGRKNLRTGCGPSA